MPNSESFDEMLHYVEMAPTYDEILVHFRRNWLHYDEKGLL